ncbi:MAG: CdaR family protein [Candidatus Wallbacteria bacterium]|nr:CdaR family protein [Candidatus Wallbacteria bacterium]
MKNLFRENIGLKIVSFLIAFFLWAYVVITENPLVNREVKITLQATNFDQNIYFMNSPLPEIKIRYQARRRQVLEAEIEKNVTAQINLKGLNEGEYDLKISANVPAGLEIISFNPSSVRVSLGKLEIKNLSPTPHMTLGNQELYLEKMEINPKTIAIKGKKDVLEQIHDAVIFIEAQSQGNFNLPLKVYLLDNDKNKIESGVIVSPPMLQVVYTVKTLPEKKVRVTPDFKGSLAQNFLLKETILEPDTVAIKAIPELLDKISEVRTEPIDLSNVSQSLKIKSNLIPPDQNITLQPKEAMVTLKIVQKMTRKTITVLLVAEPGYTIQPKCTVEAEIECADLSNLQDPVTLEVTADAVPEGLIQNYFSGKNCTLLKLRPEKISITKQGEP